MINSNPNIFFPPSISKVFGADYVKNDMVKEEPGKWYALFGFFNIFFALKLSTGMIHLWDCKGTTLNVLCSLLL
jgi:hypothetical protein